MFYVRNLQITKKSPLIDFHLEKGESIGIVGPSGGGKTTILKNIKLLRKPWDGSIIFDNKIIKSAEDYRIGYISQSCPIFPYWNVKENIMCGDLYGKKTDYRKSKHKFTKIVDMLNLSECIDKNTHGLSGGEKQRICIARTLMVEPAVILLDEPSSALDPLNVQCLVNIIQMLRGKGIIFVIVSHDTQFIQKTCDKILFLSNNVLLWHGESHMINDADTPYEVKCFFNTESFI